MTHKQLIVLISHKLKGTVSQHDIERVLGSMADLIANELAVGDIVTLRDIGTFCALPVAERMGLNPKTGEKILIPASKRVKLKPCVALKSKVQ